MADAFVRLASDASGKKVQAYENTVGADVVEAQAVTVIDGTGLTNSYVEVSEGSGKKIQYFQNTIDGQIVHAQAVTIVDTSGTP